MTPRSRIARISITAGNADELAGFYEAALGFERTRGETLSGKEFARLVDLGHLQARAITLSLGGQELELVDFEVVFNQLTGPIPPLDGLNQLQFIALYNNQLTGSIPPLARLTSLVAFSCEDNLLTGPIPPLAGLSNLHAFVAADNKLTDLAESKLNLKAAS